MVNTNKLHRLGELLVILGVALFFVLQLFSASSQSVVNSNKMHSAAPRDAASDPLCMQECSNSVRVAKRLQHRLFARNGKIVPLPNLVRALENRARILSREVVVQVHPLGEEKEFTWTLSPRQYPTILALESGWDHVSFAVSRVEIERLLRDGAIAGSQVARVAHVRNLSTDRYGVERGISENLALVGYEYNLLSLSSAIVNELEREVPQVIDAQGRKLTSVLVVERVGKTQTLSLLASGRSNFENSPVNRRWNVEKAFREHMHNIVIRPNETFSFNAILGGPVTLQKGWVEALGLFGGGAAMTPGGGVCQAATTIYRASLLAGLPIIEQKSHSMYVRYYEKHGVGMDATIFPGVQDLVFRNDTTDDIVIQSYTDGDEAVVNIFGIGDSRRVELEGPYFSRTKEKPAVLRGLSWDQIGWMRRVTYRDGSTRVQRLVSQYVKGVPSSLVTHYPVTTITNKHPENVVTVAANSVQ